MNEKAIWRFLRKNLYDLKRQYGAEVTVCKVLSVETNHKTGEKTISRDLHKVKRAIMLPEETARRVEQGIALLSANKSFVSQAGFDQGRVPFIFDSRDLPTGFKFDLDDFVNVEGEFYRITEVEEYEFNTGWVVKTHRVLGGDFNVNLEDSSESTLELSQTATVVKETP